MVVKPLIAIIKSYQKWISPLLPARCRYQPTCSQYCIEALSIHGLFKGFFLGIRRVLRCHPWGGPGHDPVPKSKD